MLGLDPKGARITWTVFLVSLFIFLAYKVRHTLLVFSLALFFAYMLSPAVNLVERLAPPRLSRNVILAVVYILFIGAMVGIGFGIGSAVSDQATNLVSKLPALSKSNDPLAALPLPHFLDPLRARIADTIREEVERLNTQAFPLLKEALTHVAAGAGSIIEFVLIPILAFFFLKDGAVIRQTIVNWTAHGSNAVILDEIFGDMHVLLGHYIRALVILSAATFTVYTLFLEFTGAQYSVLLGGLAALLEFVPVVGPLAAAVIIILVLGLTGYSHLIAVIVFIVLYRFFQDYVLSPNLMGSGVELHPLLVLFGVLAGEQIAGIPGMFFSVPVLAALRIVYVHLQRSRVRRETAVIE
jgi:predicted PurR-regulated permease PerM